MEINNLKYECLFVHVYSSFSFLIKLRQLGQIWLFNCFEGCQHILARKKVKVSQINKIILTNNRISNISGLLGLLSSMSLNTNITKIDIYGPQSLQRYIFFGRKYSQTNFRYKLYIHAISEGFILKQFNMSIYAFINQYECDNLNYFLLSSERPGFFNVGNAAQYHVPFGPLYGQLKFTTDFILPDGSIMYSHNFVHSYYLGEKLVIFDISFKRSTVEVLKNSLYH